MEQTQKSIQDMSGMELLTCVVEGRCPAPAMASTITMAIENVEPGRAEFTAMAGNLHLNPLGGVHGGFAATVLGFVLLADKSNLYFRRCVMMIGVVSDFSNSGNHCPNHNEP